AIDQLPIGARQRAAPGIGVVVADVDKHQAEIGDARDFHHAAVQPGVAPLVVHVHARPGIQPQPVPAGRDGRAARHLLVAQAVFQQVAAEQAVDVEVAQGCVCPLSHADNAVVHGLSPFPGVPGPAGLAVALPAADLQPPGARCFAVAPASGSPIDSAAGSTAGPSPAPSATAALDTAVATRPAATR